MGIFRRFFGGEPNMDGRDTTRRANDRIIGEAASHGRHTDPEGFSLESRHRRQRSDGWSDADEVDRNAGEDWTRRR